MPYDLTLTTPQSDFFISQAEHTAAVAGFGSGKTQAALTRLLATKLAYPSVHQAYLAPTYSLIRDIFYPKISEVLGEMGLRFTINRTEHIIYVQGGGQIICKSMKHPDSIVGWESGDVFMDEFDTLSIENAKLVMNKVSARARMVYPDGKINQKWITTTPEGFKATYEYFQKDPLPGSNLIQMSTYSNEVNLPNGYIDNLFRLYPDQLIDAYLLGKFVNLTVGSVYPMFDRQHNNTHYVQSPRETLHIGMDFNVYKMSAIVHVIRNNEPYAVDEIMGARDTPDMIEAIQQRYTDAKNPIIVFPDSTGGSANTTNASTSDIKLLRDAGFRIDAPAANPPIRDRVVSMNGMFHNAKQERRYRVNVEKCPNYTLSLEQQVYDKTGKPDKAHDQDHPNDAAGYFIHRRFPAQRHTLVQRSLPM